MPAAAVGRPWAIDLTAAPTVVRVGVGVHGVHRRTEEWLLPTLWSVHLYSYRGELEIGRDRVEVAPGMVTVIPPATPMRFTYRGRSRHLFAHLAQAGAGDQRVPSSCVLSPARQAEVRAAWEDAVTAFPVSPARACADMWTVLWRLNDACLGSVCAARGAELRTGRATPGHPVVAAAVGLLEHHLADAPSVPELARRVGVSPNHLTRLFRRELGCTVVAYLRTRRMAHAEHLLRHSTLSITSIGAAVGIPDLQAFNKAVRRELGRAPSAVRAGPG